MGTVTTVIQDNDVKILSTILTVPANYALAIVRYLSAGQITQLQQRLQLESTGTADLQLVESLLHWCQKHGIDLSEMGVNAFKAAHHLGNTGADRGAIGPQTAQVYFTTLMESEHSPEQAALETVPTSDLQTNLNAAILATALHLRGMSTLAGPDGGNNACAWTINQVLEHAGIVPLGENPNYVPSLVEALQTDRGQRIDRAEAKAGDLVVAFDSAHIGIGLEDGCTSVLSNSSSSSAFVWESDLDFDGYYGGESTVYRLLR
jgi:hypothetical protein